MDHRIYACARRDGSRQAERELGIEQNAVGIEAIGDDAFFSCFTRCENGDIGDLAACARCCRDEKQRKLWSLGIADAIHGLERLVATRKMRRDFGRIHG